MLYARAVPKIVEFKRKLFLFGGFYKIATWLYLHYFFCIFPFIANRQEYDIHLGIELFHFFGKRQSVNTAKLNFADQNVTALFFGKCYGVIRIGISPDGCI